MGGRPAEQICRRWWEIDTLRCMDTVTDQIDKIQDTIRDQNCVCSRSQARSARAGLCRRVSLLTAHKRVQKELVQLMVHPGREMHTVKKDAFARLK